jgi:hypothetical protein
MYASSFILCVNKLIVVLERYIEELKKKLELDVDPRLVAFDVDASYAMGEGLPHGRCVKRY